MPQPPKRASDLQRFIAQSWLCDGDACAVERAAYPLHCAGIDAEPFGNDAHTGSSRRRQGLTDSFFECGGNRGAPEAFTLTPGPQGDRIDPTERAAFQERVRFRRHDQ